MLKIEATLPPDAAKTQGIGDLLRALGQETQRVEQGAMDAQQRLFASQSDETGISRWETELGLTHRTDLPLPAGRWF